MSKEAMKLALEALIFNQAHWQGKDKAVVALKQALEQPEPEPVAEVRCDDGGNLTAKFHVRDLPLFAPLYPFPPKREWQGLTDEEKNVMTWGNDIYHILELAEAKLKEKNNV